ncbi:MAG: chemotaxis protein CheX [Magnetococcus sp. WYHC-3]
MEEIIAGAVMNGMRDIAVAMLSLDIGNGPTVVRTIDGAYDPPQADATALVRLSGGIDGGIYLSAPEHVALFLAGRLAGEPFDELSAEAQDGYGELANMVAGGIQTHLSVDYGEIQLEPPQFIHRGDNKAQINGFMTSIRQFFKCDEGPFFVEVFVS